MSIDTLPFGKHKGRPLPEIPSDYLTWLAKTCRLSSGLRAAVGVELARRGLEAPPIPAVRPSVPPCPRCGDAGFVARWQEDVRGNRRVRAECRRCRKWMTFLPSLPPWTGEADAAASATPSLDALTRLDELGIELESDGLTAWVPWPDARRVPAELLAVVRQCARQLGRMIGKTRKQRP
jgi:hypothetical protein